MSNDAPLLRLGNSTAEAVEGKLKTWSGEDVGRGAVQMPASAAESVSGLALPAVAAEVSYVDGVTGGNLFVLPIEGARRLAAAMEGKDPESADANGELSELELSAVGEAMNQMMSAAALATAGVLGQEVEIAPPRIRTVASEAEAAELFGAGGSAHLVSTDFSVLGATSRLIQLVPNAFVVKMTRALDELTQSYTSAPLSDSLRAVPVRVWAELGRARMAAGASLGVTSGCVVELDREVDEPIDLYVDGMRFATGRLLVAEDGTLQLEVDSVLGLQETAPAADHVETVSGPTPASPEPEPQTESELQSATERSEV
jgi:flagellar motor switch protein FliN/FliY